MASGLLSNANRERGRRLLPAFQGLNAVSYLILSGSFMTLFALHLGASSFFIGLISSFQYLSYVFMLGGRGLVGVLGVRNLVATGWLVRVFFMVPLLFSPVLVARGGSGTVLSLIAFGLFFFHVSRGMGVVGFNPLVGAVSEGRDRGEFLTRLQIFDQTGAVVGGLLIVLFLGKAASVTRYTLFIGLGVVLGVATASILYRVPEVEETETTHVPHLLTGIQEAMKRTSVRRFVVLYFALCVVIGMSDPFRPVYAKLVYLRPDPWVLLFAVVGNVGAILMGLLSRLLMDRLGAKPLFVLFTGFLAASTLPLVVSPALSGVALAIFMSAFFFVFQIGLVGSQNGAQNYFFGIISAAEFLNLGILYNLCQGVGGAIGSLLGGSLIGLIKAIGFSDNVRSFRAYFVLVFLALLAILLLSIGLRTIGRYTVRSALGIIFSPRDLRAAALLHKLDRSRTAGEEIEVIKALADSPSEMAIDNLIEKLRSPRFYVRSEALRALEFMPPRPRITRALIGEVKGRRFSTASIAARIIGELRLPQAIRALRLAVRSSDYLLQANSMLALGRMGDRVSIPLIEEEAKGSHNPLVLIHAATALEELESVESIPTLLELLRRPSMPPFVRNELILSIAGIIGIGDWFYAHFMAFLEGQAAGRDSLLDHLDARYREGAEIAKAQVRKVVELMPRNRTEFAREVSRLLWILSGNIAGPVPEARRSLLPTVSLGAGRDFAAAREAPEPIRRQEVLAALIEAASDPLLVSSEQFSFLLAGVLAWGVCDR